MKVFLSLFTIALNAILAENFILVKFMGIAPSWAYPNGRIPRWAWGWP